VAGSVAWKEQPVLPSTAVLQSVVAGCRTLSEEVEEMLQLGEVCSVM
jgi:hypothetical protein